MTMKNVGPGGRIYEISPDFHVAHAVAGISTECH